MFCEILLFLLSLFKVIIFPHLCFFSFLCSSYFEQKNTQVVIFNVSLSSSTAHRLNTWLGDVLFPPHNLCGKNLF